MMVIDYFFIFGLIASAIFDFSDLQNATNNIIIEKTKEDIYKEKISDIFKKRLSFEENQCTKSMLFCTSVPKNVSLKVINDIKALLSLTKKEDEIIYYRQIKNVCGEIYQGFDKPIEFLDDFIDFSLFYRHYPSNVNILEFNKHSFSFSVNFSDSNNDTIKLSNQNNQPVEFNESKSDVSAEKKDEKGHTNIPDLYMITDLSESYENYLNIREKLQQDINNFYSTPEKIFSNYFKNFCKSNDIKLNVILRLFFYPSFIMNSDYLWTWLYEKKLIEIQTYFKTMLCYKEKELADYRKHVHKFSDYLIYTHEANSKIKDLQVMVNFFEKIREKEWINVLILLKEYASKEKNTHILCALSNKNVFLIQKYLNVIFEEIGENLYLQNKLFFSYYIFDKWHIHGESEKSYYMEIKESKNIKECFSIKKISMIAMKTKNSIARLFFLNGNNYDFIETYYNIDSPISVENSKIREYDWIFNYNLLDEGNYNEASILVLKPNLEKYIDINTLKWFEHQIRNIFENIDILTVYRNHVIRENIQMDCGFLGFYQNNLCGSVIAIPFLKRECFYKSFVHNMLNFIKTNNLIIENSFITNNVNCFVPFSLTDVKIGMFNFKNNEILYNQRKNYLENPNNNKKIDINLPWIRSQIEFFITLKENNGKLARTIFKIELEENCREFFYENLALNIIFDAFHELIYYDIDDNDDYEKIYEICKDKGMRLLTVGIADKICRIIYEGDLTKSKFLQALDLLVSDILFEAYLAMRCIPKDELNDKDKDYSQKYVENLKNQIFAKIEIDFYEKLKINRSYVNFSITNNFEFDDLNNARSNEIYKMILRYRWDIN